MSEVSAPAPDRVTFDDLHLAAILPVPKHVLADFLPHHAESAHRGMKRGLSLPLDALLEAEGLPRFDRLGRGVRAKIEKGIGGKVARLELTKTFVNEDLKAATNKVEAYYLVNGAYINFQDLIDVVGKANHWPTQGIKDVKGIMAAELVSFHSEPAWEWWLDLAIGHEYRKQRQLSLLHGRE